MISSYRKELKAALVSGVVIIIGSLFHYYMDIGEGRVFGAFFLIVFLINTCYLTKEHYNSLCEVPRRDLEDKKKCLKFISELASAMSVVGVAVSLWFVYANFDSQNSHAKWLKLESAQNQLQQVITPSFCQSKPYRQMQCASLKRDGEELTGLLVTSSNEKIAAKIRSMEYSMDNLSNELDSAALVELLGAKSKINDMVGLEEGERMAILLIIFSILMITSCVAASRKVAVAAFEFFDKPSSQAQPILASSFLGSLWDRFFSAKIHLASWLLYGMYGDV